MFIIDFDDTLFDTQRYHRAHYQSVADLGITPEVYWQAYQDTRLDTNGNFIYNSDRHVAQLEKQGFNGKEIARRFNILTEKITDFLFNDTHAFLNEIKGLGKAMLLLTWGYPEFQRYSKVEPSGITRYFDEILYTCEPKQNRLLKLFEERKVDNTWFINDKPEETVKLSGLFPQLRPVLKYSPLFPESDYKNLGLPYFQTLTEIKEYVLSQSK